MSQIKFVKVAYVHDWLYANRDRREVDVAAGLGWDVTVVKPDTGKDDESDRYGFLKLPTKPHKKWPNKLNQISAGIRWAKEIAKLEPDIISGHNLIGMYIAMLSNKKRKDKKKARLVYDAHEYLMGQLVRSNALKRKFSGAIEKYVIKHSDLPIFVNDSICDAVQKDYKLNERPLCVRNLPYLAPEIPEDVKAQARKELEDLFEDKGEKFIVMFHGQFRSGCSMEKLVKAVEAIPSMYLVFLGYATNPDYYENLIKSSPAHARIAIHGAVPQKELWKYIAAADVEAVIIENKNASYYYSLPNKLLESVQALTPVIGSNYPEIKAVIEKHNVGITCTPEDQDSINKSIEYMIANRDFIDQCRINCASAKKELCWENESKILGKAFKGLEDKIG